MLTTAILSVEPVRHAAVPAPSDSIQPAAMARGDASVARRIADTLQQVEDALTPQRRVVHAGDPIYRAGDPFGNLYLLNSGLAKVVGLSADGREQVVGLKFRGDWLGFDGIANGQYGCDAVAMDTGEVWVIRYDALLLACRRDLAAHRGVQQGDRVRREGPARDQHSGGRCARRLRAALSRAGARDAAIGARLQARQIAGTGPAGAGR